MSVILYYVIFIFASTAFWAPTVCAFPNLWGLPHGTVHSTSFLKTQPTLNRRQARWSEILQPYDFKWEYRPGRTNVADPLSRIPVGKVETMGEPGCASALCAICGPSYDQVAIPRPEATSSSLIWRLVDRYAIDIEFQKLLPTQKNWEYRGGL